MRQEQAELQRENDKLKRRLAHWKGQLKRTKVPTLRQRDVDKLARKLTVKFDMKLLNEK